MLMIHSIIYIDSFPLLTLSKGTGKLLHFSGGKSRYSPFFDSYNYIIGCTVGKGDIVGFVVEIDYHACSTGLYS